MKWEALLNLVKDKTVFSSGFLLASAGSQTTLQRQLDRWVKSGRLVQLRRGFYSLAQGSPRARWHPFQVANELVSSSYVSLQSALAYYGMVPENVPVTTSVTSGRPLVLTTAMGVFSYRHIKVKALFGYSKVKVTRDQESFIASPEKALIDLLYLTPRSDAPAYLSELRLEFHENFSFDVCRELAFKLGSLKVQRAVNRLAVQLKEEE